MTPARPSFFFFALCPGATGCDGARGGSTDDHRDGACPTEDVAGTCTWLSDDEAGVMHVQFEGDDGTTAAYGLPGDAGWEDDFVGYADELLLDCVDDHALEEGDTFACTLTEIGGGGEPGLFIECD